MSDWEGSPYIYGFTVYFGGGGDGFFDRPLTRCLVCVKDQIVCSSLS